jgi:hypothetical protein
VHRLETQQKQKSVLTINDLTLEDRNKLVGVFAWLIKEDKKQNPALYQIKKKEND